VERGFGGRVVTPAARAVAAARPGDYGGLLSDISGLFEQARRQAVRHVNSVLTATYWQVGRRIVEFVQDRVQDRGRSLDSMDSRDAGRGTARSRARDAGERLRNSGAWRIVVDPIIPGFDGRALSPGQSSARNSSRVSPAWSRISSNVPFGMSLPLGTMVSLMVPERSRLVNARWLPLPRSGASTKPLLRSALMIRDEDSEGRRVKRQRLRGAW